jgi:hypothetical protein
MLNRAQVEFLQKQNDQLVGLIRKLSSRVDKDSSTESHGVNVQMPTNNPPPPSVVTPSVRRRERTPFQVMIFT